MYKELSKLKSAGLLVLQTASCTGTVMTSLGLAVMARVAEPKRALSQEGLLVGEQFLGGHGRATLSKKCVKFNLSENLKADNIIRCGWFQTA